MYFKKLEIVGFKSFAEKTSLRFEPGVTAIVGPNGCGKSNIFDSIRWVLGEQSIKSLRGSKMEDVIFNGTEKVPALGMAQVSITLSNEAKILPIDYEEITITRRLFRSGESEYLLNDNVVRLKDINELLMGTGIGAESYSLVEQGKIDLVLSSKPEDRRLVFDEATGVSKYKAKKKEALRKLEETENNLLRVNDIIVEVRRQIGSIERQASKARRYKEVFDQLKELEIKLARFEISELGKKRDDFEQSKTKLKDDIDRLTQSLSEINQKIYSHQSEIENFNQELIDLNSELINTRNLIDKDTHHIKINDERVVELTKRLQIIDTQKVNLTKRLEYERESVLRVKSELDNIQSESQAKQVTLREKEIKLKEIENLLAQAQERIKLANNKNFEIASNKAKFNNELIDINSSLNTLNSRKRRLETEILKTGEERNTNQTELNQAKLVVDEIKAKFENIKKELGTISEESRNIETEVAKTQEEINKLHEVKITLESQRQFLKELTLKYETMPAAKDADLVIKGIDQIDEREISGIIAKAKSVTYNKSSKTYHINCEAKLFSLDIKTIDEKIAQVDLEIAQRNNTLDIQRNTALELSNKKNQLESNMQKEQLILADKDASLKNIQSNFDKISDELSILQFELKDVEENSVKYIEKKDALTTELSSLEQENQNQEEIINLSQSEISDNAKIREAAIIELTQIRTELSSVTAKESDLTASFSMLEKSLLTDQEALLSHDNEKDTCNSKIEELKQESTKLQEDIKNREEKTVIIQKDLNAKRIELSQKESVLKGLKEEEQKQNTELTNNRDHLHEQQLTIQENSFRINQLKERMTQLFQFNIDTEPAQELPVDFDATAIKGESEALRKKVESFGTVNLIAIEELEELKQRYDFLEQQQKDLHSAKESLNEAIRKINRTTRSMFLETFQIVAKEFKNYFRLLFGGGDAELFLLDEDNVLESGIEIICRPPGKKLQNILLLSGGEKTLSAIALIFAIFKTKPAPFCVLDEIDAALDETNVDRYSRMLEDFAKISQFIVITHNKKTIAHANVMYGITMEQSGMSRIVSVKFEEKPNKENNKETKDDSSLSAVEAN